MSEFNSLALQSDRHHHFHAHIPFHLWHPVLSWSCCQRAGYLRGGSVQEENGIRHLRV